MPLRDQKWWWLGWHWTLGRKRPWRLYTSLCFSNINYPRVRWELRDPDVRYISLEVGNGNSDPVWSVSFEWGSLLKERP